MPESAQKVLHELTSAGILSSGEVTAFDSEVAVGAQALLDRLLSEDRITRYQADKFLAGQSGDICFGDYVVLEELGRGGMGTVLLANHRRMDRRVAIKILSTTMLDSESAVARFYQEVKVAAQLTHPNIVHAYDSGEHHGFHYLVMEYVPGQDLARVLEQIGPIPVGLALDYIMQAARGLEYAHGKGVVHRDIKPSNLLLNDDGTIKILDMGLAQIGGALGDDSAHLTTTGQMMGTVEYMSPEQAEDTRNADQRSDIYSLGCTLYRLITGAAPFSRETVVKTILAHREAPIPAFAATPNPALTPVENLFRTMVAKKPEHRYQNATLLLNDLRRQSEQLSASLDGLTLSPPAAPSTDVDIGPTIRERVSDAVGSAANDATIARGSTPQLLSTPSGPSPSSNAVYPEDEIVMATHVDGSSSASSPIFHIHADAKPHRGRRLLIMGILGMFLGLAIVGAVLGIITWVFANSDLQEMREGKRDSSGVASTKAARVLGIIATIIGGISILAGIIGGIAGQ